MNKLTIPHKIQLRLNELNLNESFDKKIYIISIYNDYNYFLSRTFDVHFSKAKKAIDDKMFKVITGRITRVL